MRWSALSRLHDETILKTLPEAQRTQDIEFIIQIIFMTEIKQTNKQTSKQTNKQTNNQTIKQSNKQTNKQNNKQTNKMFLYISSSHLEYFLKHPIEQPGHRTGGDQKVNHNLSGQCLFVCCFVCLFKQEELIRKGRSVTLNSLIF